MAHPCYSKVKPTAIARSTKFWGHFRPNHSQASLLTAQCITAMSVDWAKFKPDSGLLHRIQGHGQQDIVAVALGGEQSSATAAGIVGTPSATRSSSTDDQPGEFPDETEHVSDDTFAAVAKLEAFQQGLEGLLSQAGSGVEFLVSLEKHYIAATSKMDELHSQCKRLVEQQVRASA